MESRKILLVDDEPTVGDFLGDFLVEQGYEVKVLTQPLRCLEEAAKGRYEMLIADIRMPGMDGLELAERVKEVCSNILCIVLTGYGTLESMRTAMRLGINDYLVKPCPLEELRAAVETVFARRHPPRTTAPSVRETSLQELDLPSG